MKPGTTLLCLAAAALALTASMTTPAQAQATRTWVSGVGDDANPCSRTAPCKTFAGAISKTAAGGEIDCLDPGGFGVVTITKSITIDCGSGETGAVGSILASGVQGIVVSAGASDVVQIKKVSINGAGSTLGTNGINFAAGQSLLVDNVNIMNFSGFGITYTAGAGTSLNVVDTNITHVGNGSNGAGIFAKPTGAGSAFLALERVKLTKNDVGLQADGSTSLPLKVSVSDSLSSGNLFAGILAQGATGQVNMMIGRSTSSLNGSFGVRANQNAAVFLGTSTVSGNLTGVEADGGSTLKTYQNNQINQNGTDFGPGVTTTSPN